MGGGLCSRGGASGEVRLFGVDVESVGPRARVAAALSVILPVALSGVFLMVFVPDSWWVFTTYFWVAFPAFRVLGSGVAGLAGDGTRHVSASSAERELLEVLKEHGEVTPARAAAETSLTVAGAAKMLEGLAGDGHLEVRVRDGGIFYALWGAEVLPASGVRREVAG